MTSDFARHVACSIEAFVPHDPVIARSMIGLAGLPTIVATGPFDDRFHAEQLAAAFATVRRRCKAQLVLFGTGPHRITVLRRTFTLGVGADVHLLKGVPAAQWSDVVAAADVVVPSDALGQVSLLDAMAVGRPVVAPLDATTVRLVLPTSAGLVYHPGDVSGMAAALLRLLTSPALRNGMACRAGEVARRHLLQMRLEHSADGSVDA